jgi:hypothetical protein
MSRGNRREEIFRDDLDRKRFLVTLHAACQKTSWQVHAYCLMSNHFHLAVETPRANLVQGDDGAAQSVILRRGTIALANIVCTISPCWFVVTLRRRMIP